MYLDFFEDRQRPAHARHVLAAGLMSGQFLDDARLVRDLVVR
jgi:hypothetical protein